MALGLSVVPLLRCNTFAARRFPSVKSLSSPKTVIGVAEDYEHNLCLNVNSIHSFLPAPTRTRMHIPALYMSDQFFTSLQFTRSVEGESAMQNDDFSVAQPSCINDLPEKLLMSGITFPGIFDKLGRSMIIYDAETVKRSELTERDVASVISYYSNINKKIEKHHNGMSILVISPSTSPEIDLLDKSLSLISNFVHIDCVLITWKRSDHHRVRHFRSGSNHSTRSNVLNISKVKSRILTESDSLEEYIEWIYIPSEYGGQSTHDQLEWVQFYKEVEPFLTKCHACGRRLVSVMSEIKSNEGVSLSRRQLYQQQRQLTRVLNDVELLRLRKDGPTILAQIEDRVQWLPNSYDVSISAERCDRLFAEVEKSAKRIEQLVEKRKEKLKELIRIKALEEEANQRYQPQYSDCSMTKQYLLAPKYPTTGTEYTNQTQSSKEMRKGGLRNKKDNGTNIWPSTKPKAPSNVDRKYKGDENPKQTNG
ncbi:hypothetical protein V9T40_005026 [Parthenolecanium corni]|uniref:Uncharacterized protein n=1 Tax=Parthenolecanium corni TaxID=536013 RepID=A0AAN9THE5_9HEMI